ncbi:MAG: dihydroorotate dehydrogenase [Coriobacteriales bacterium]|jgi:dihydroorotate dehydrogenase (NAD+) catalytic subunit|nr:dihydroorotate dehydrogenase [Coriobacteriales bacterium]
MVTTRTRAPGLNLAVELGGLAMKNPLTVASGTFASGREYAALWRGRAEYDSGPADGPGPTVADGPEPSVAAPLSLLGALITKGVTLEARPGNPGIRVAESPSGLLNSIGLQNPGVEAFCQEELAYLAEQKTAVIVNVSGSSVSDYQAVIERLEREEVPQAYELNISCPNVDCGGMAFGVRAVDAERLTRACRARTARPLIVKLTPNVTDITEIARACEAGGADALSLINTVAGMAIDVQRRRPLFERGVAGLSGPAIKPIALYAVHRVFRAVDIPLLGMGGIASVEDVVSFMLAGAQAVAIGTENFRDPFALPRLLDELIVWCNDNNLKDINELRGALK